MNKIPVDVSNLSVMLVQPPTPKVDTKSGEIKTEKGTGKTLINVPVAVVVEERHSAITVVVAQDGVSPDLAPGKYVQLYNLFASPWENDFGHGISYKASAVTLADAAQNAPAPAPAKTTAKAAA